MDITLELTIASQLEPQVASRVVLRTERRHNQETPQLREDGHYALTLRCPSEFGIPILAVQGYDLDEGKLLEQDGVTTAWRWGPSPHVFRNCFGLTIFRADFDDGRAFEFQPVEVLAQKLKAEHAQNMLEYLWRQSPELLYACFARTSAGGAFGDGHPSIERVLHQAEALISSIEELVLSSRSSVRKRLVEHLDVKPLGAGDVIDDRSVHYIINNLQHASPTPSEGSTGVRLQYRSLYFDSMAVVRKSESTDVYENRVIHGLLWTVERRLLEVSTHLDRIVQEIQARIVPQSPAEDGAYARFQTVCGYYIHQVAKRPLERVGDLLRRLRRCQRRSQDVMPAKLLTEVPRLTPTFSLKRHYRAVFRRAHEWYQMGNGLATVSDFLMGLRTIDRLYEYYCLFTLLEIATKDSWRLGEVRHERNPSESAFDSIADAYFLSHDLLGRIEIHYEPKVPPLTSGLDFWGLVKVAGSATESYRPDFMLRWTPASGGEVVAVLDAKYSTHETIRYRHLPDVVLKYLFGIRHKHSPERASVDHLCLVGPTPKATPLWDYHYHGRGLGIRPTVHIGRAYPGQDSSGLEMWFKHVLIRRTTLVR